MKVVGLYVYPIKSCRGIPLQKATLDGRGIVSDRSLMVVDSSGHFLTQRQHPRMALIEVEPHEEFLILKAPDCLSLIVELQFNGDPQTVVIWRDCCQAIDQGDEAAVWLSDFLGIPCRLVQMAPDFVRGLDPVYTAHGQVGFADGYPFLLTNEASWQDLNERMAAPLPMDRFRPNIVVAGAEAYAEDSWQQIRVGEVIFEVVKPSIRCRIPTTDQLTGEQGSEPLQTLATYRLVQGEIHFGQNLVHHSAGEILLGDDVEVLAYRQS
ncbi:MAG: MOSC N-terminal beta barrel domain-containing protein [Cyanobacteriota bacterium]|nr:MOSC N-terminal beta barrel domain-containing protein [Cyanobacteriota bacterium]